MKFNQWVVNDVTVDTKLLTDLLSATNCAKQSHYADLLFAMLRDAKTVSVSVAVQEVRKP